MLLNSASKSNTQLCREHKIHIHSDIICVIFLFQYKCQTYRKYQPWYNWNSEMFLDYTFVDLTALHYPAVMWRRTGLLNEQLHSNTKIPMLKKDWPASVMLDARVGVIMGELRGRCRPEHWQKRAKVRKQMNTPNTSITYAFKKKSPQGILFFAPQETI